jgi:hypothetical protein
MSKIVLASAFVLASFAGIAMADPGEYVQANPGVAVTLSITDCAPLGIAEGTSINFGGVRFCAGHLVGDANGDNGLTIADDAISPASGVYCQDPNANQICGEAPVPPDGAIRLEPRARFCGSVILDSPVDMTARADWSTSNWDPAFDVLVFVDAVGNGNPATNSPCGTVSFTTHGFVNHV